MKTIIIADEDSSVRNLVRLIFTEDTGYRVISASSGTDAVLKALQIKPDVVIADVSLSDKSGYIVSKEIKNAPFLENTYVLLLASSLDAFDEKTFAEACADDLIVKPFEPEAIIKKLRSFAAVKKERVPALIVRLGKVGKPASYGIAALLMISVFMTAVLYGILSRSPAETELKTGDDVKKERIISEIRREEINTSEFDGDGLPPLDSIMEDGYEPVGRVMTASYRNRGEFFPKPLKAQPRKQASPPEEARGGKFDGDEYVVKKGDTLWRIAAAFNTSVAEIKGLNNLKDNGIGVGDILTVPFKDKGRKAGGSFTIQVGAFHKQEWAQETIRDLTSKGYPVSVKTVWTPEKGVWHKVMIGTFQTREEAKLYADNLKSREPLVKEAIVSN